MSSSTLADFDILAQLGKGSFGVVYKVRRKLDGSLYVLKSISLSALSAKEQRECTQEVRLLASLDSPHVVRYFDSFLQDDQLHIVMELCEQGDLHQMLRKQNKTLLPEDSIWRYFIQAALGLHHLHARKILHRDVKSMNLFLDANNDVKVGDLGVAKMLDSTSGFAHTVIGTPYYLSPELCEGKPYNEKSDVWALGIVLYELCTLRHPFDAANQGALVLRILRGRYPPLPAAYAASKLQRVTDACLRKDTALRPTLTQVLASSAVYSKAQQLGLELPEEVRTLVESRKTAPAAVGSHKHLEHGVIAAEQRKRAAAAASTAASSVQSEASHTGPIHAAVAPDRGGLARTQRKSRARIGTSNTTSGAALPVVSGVAPARAAPSKVVLALKPGAKRPAPVKKTAAAPASSAAAQSVRDLPDVLIQAIPRQPMSFIPSPEPDYPDASVLPVSNKPSASMLKQFISRDMPSAAASASSTSTPAHVTPLSSARSVASNASNEANAGSMRPQRDGDVSARSDRDGELEGEDADASAPASGATSDSEHPDADDPRSPQEQAADEDAYIAATIAALELEEEAEDIDPDLVDQSHDHEMSGSADDVQWRIVDEAEQQRQQEEELYDSEEVDESAELASSVASSSAAAPSTARSTTPSLPSAASVPAAALPRPPTSLTTDVNATFGVGAAAPASPHSTDPAAVFRAVAERAHKLRAHIAELTEEVVAQIGHQRFEVLHEYFRAQANAPQASPGGSEGDGAAAGSSESTSHFVLRILQPSQLEVVTKLYQMLYLEEECEQCASILALAKQRERNGVAVAGAPAPSQLNVTPRIHARGAAAAATSTGGAAVSRSALQRKTRVSTAAAAVPASNGSGAPAPSRRATGPRATPAASTAQPLAHTIAPAGAVASTRQRRK